MTTGPRRILILEGDADPGTALVETLHRGGFAAEIVGRVEDVLRCITLPPGGFDALLMHAERPDVDGCGLCDRVRRTGWAHPIIMLTTAEAGQDVVRALEIGATDCLVRPYGGAELMARLRAHLRAFEEGADAIFPIGPFLFRPAAKSLRDRRDGRSIWLTDKEVSLLRTLLRAGGDVVPAHRLLGEARGHAPAGTAQVLVSRIHRLRRKLGDCGRGPSILRKGDCGYRLVVPDFDGSRA